jgi:hypothetical protein
MNNTITKTIFAGLILACASTTVSAQTVNKFGINSMTIEASAVLELESKTKGFLAPRMTEDQKNAIILPAEGLLVYQTDVGKKGFYSYSGTAWVLSTTAGNLPLANLNLFVGNGDGIAKGVALGGDATITNSGLLTIKDSAITNIKLDKSNIPLSGFKAAAANVAFGGFKLTGVAEPTEDQDAATRNYVDVATAVINTLVAGHIYIGDGLNVAQEVALTGDISIDSTGLSTIKDSTVVTTMIKNLNVSTDKIAKNAVTYGKMQEMTAAGKLLGSGLAGTAVAELSLGTGLSFTGTTINASNNIGNVITVTADQSLTAADNSVYTSAAMTLTLPAPVAGNQGLTFRIIKTDNDTILTFSQSIYTTTNAADAFTTLNYAKAISIQSNGTNWYLVN